MMAKDGNIKQVHNLAAVPEGADRVSSPLYNVHWLGLDENSYFVLLVFDLPYLIQINLSLDWFYIWYFFWIFVNNTKYLRNLAQTDLCKLPKE